MIYNHFLAIVLAYVIDLLIGDPKNWPHPVRWIGSMISFLDVRLNRGKYLKKKGMYMLLIVIIITFSISFFITYYSYKWHPVVGVIVEAIIIATTIAQKSLKDAALEVFEPLKASNIEEARKKLSYIVGRDTDHLSEAEIVRGTVETVAENTSDGITAPLFWAMIGGAPLAVIYRAVNTCDSMVGYKSEKYMEFGWASARFDDCINWIPARITGFLIMLTASPKETSFKKAFAIFLRDVRKHNSPNSGWCEAAFSALLGVQLGGANYYQGVKSRSPTIGESLTSLEAKHISQAIVMMQRTVTLFLVLIILGGIFYEFTITWF